MANREEEAAPLLSPEAHNADDVLLAGAKPRGPLTLAPAVSSAPAAAVGCGEKGSAKWAAEGVPIFHGSVFGEPLLREQWDSGLFSCIGRNDEFCSSDLEGNCETLARSVGCHRILRDEGRREQLESICDLATHLFCHPCALCQEGRELRRRLPHPGFNGCPVIVMMPPMEQTMGRPAA